jgi:hypothetical protein
MKRAIRTERSWEKAISSTISYLKAPRALEAGQFFSLSVITLYFFAHQSLPQFYVQLDRVFRMNTYTLLLVILILLLVGALPTWPYSSAWGYYPSGGFGTVFVIVLIVVLLGR